MIKPIADIDFESGCLTVRLESVVGNYKIFQRLAGPSLVAAVVKADAYGLGADMIASRLAIAGCDTFFVARLEEGVRLRPLVPTARIFVLDGGAPDAVPALIHHRLTPVLNSLAEIAGWDAAARASHTRLDCAIHIDTGMNRLGLPGHELSTLVTEHAKRLEHLRVVLWMSHLASADDGTSRMNEMQLARFRDALAMLPGAPASLAASGGVLLGKDYHFDMVRPGLGLYGANPQPDAANPFSVAAVLAGRILQLRRVDKGESVGYAATFRAKKPTLIATVALGYADGLMRSIANKGFAAIAGQRAPIVGRISMDLTTLDVTHLPPEILITGAEVEFVGDTISLEEMADAAGTNAYEILTSLHRRCPRHYVEGHAAEPIKRTA
jgi:alanine racemase